MAIIKSLNPNSAVVQRYFNQGGRSASQVIAWAQGLEWVDQGLKDGKTAKGYGNYSYRQWGFLKAIVFDKDQTRIDRAFKAIKALGKKATKKAKVLKVAEAPAEYVSKKEFDALNAKLDAVLKALAKK